MESKRGREGTAHRAADVQSPACFVKVLIVAAVLKPSSTNVRLYTTPSTPAPLLMPESQRAAVFYFLFPQVEQK